MKTLELSYTLVNTLKEVLVDIERGISPPRVIKGEEYSLGGTHGNCWNDYIGTISPDTPPTSFENFDSFLYSMDKNISFMVYKVLENEFVTTDTYSYADYYGGSETYGYSQFDMGNLVRYLLKENITTLEILYGLTIIKDDD